jgi:hypothetical protein
MSRIRFLHLFRHLSDHPSIWRCLLWICNVGLQKAALVRIHPGLREWRRAFPRRLSANAVWARVWTVDIHWIYTHSRMQIRGTRDRKRYCDAFVGIILTSVCLSTQSLFLVPLPILTIWVMGYFQQQYALPSRQLSMERARECDRISDLRAARRRGTPNARGQGVAERREQFDKSAYRQPVLTLQALEPMHYRANQPDPITEETNVRLRSANRYLYTSDSARGKGLQNSGRGLGLQTTGDVV